MQLFLGRSSKPQQRSGGNGGGGGGSGKNVAVAAATTAKAAAGRHRNGGKCRGLCCGGSRLSVSSSASCSSADAPEEAAGLSDLAHGMVQARLRSMIDAAGLSSAPAADRRRGACGCSCARGCGCGCGGGYDERRPCVVLVAVDRRTRAPREEFRRSIAEVITAKRMAEPAELRALLNCYVSVNAREHRAAILEAFHEVCSALFSSCKG